MTLSTLLYGKNYLKGSRAGRNYRDRDRGCVFTVGIRFNQELGFLEVLSFWGEGVGAAIYLGAILSNNFFLASTGLLIVFIAVVALVMHLGQAGRAWRVPANLATAWVSRGSLIIAGFIGSGLIWMYLGYVSGQGPYRTLAFLASFSFAVLMMCYAGWLLGSIKAVQLWSGSLLPVTFIFHSLTSGIVVLACWHWMDADSSKFNFYISQMTIVSLAICFILTVMHLRRSANSLAVAASVERLANGDLKVVFHGAAIILGIAVPLFLVAAYTWWRDIIAYEFVIVLAVATVASRLAGDLAYRYAVVRAGAYEPIL